MVTFPEASHPAIVSLAASSALQLMTVSEESGNGLYAPVSTFTASLAPALIFSVLSPTRASGRVEDTTRTVTPAFTVPAPYAICTGMDAVVPGAASLVAETCKLPERDRLAVIRPDDELPPEYVYCFSSSYTPDGAWVSAVRSTVLGAAPASTSIVEDENVGGGTSRPITVIWRVITAELMILVLSDPCLPSTAVKVMEAGPA